MLMNSLQVQNAESQEAFLSLVLFVPNTHSFREVTNLGMKEALEVVKDPSHQITGILKIQHESEMYKIPESRGGHSI